MKVSTVVAALDSLLIAPAAIFMAALVIRNVPLDKMAPAAHGIVMWYSERIWTLWVLLLALPFAVLTTGCVVLFQDRLDTPDGPRQPLAFVRAQPAGLLLAALTLSATVILAIVILHMLAN